MSLNQNSPSALKIQANTFSSSGARTGTALSAAYVHLTSGPAVAIRYVALSATPINECLVFTDLTTGTRANINMRCRIYNEGATATVPGSTLRATATTVTYPAADDQWVRAVFGTPYTPAVGEIVWIIWDNNAASPAVDFPSIMTSNTTLINSLNSNRMVGSLTANGYVAGSNQLKMPFMVLEGSTWYGQPVTQFINSAFTSNQLKRGIVVTPTTNLLVSHVETGGTSATLATVEVFESTQLPNATPIYSANFSTIGRLIGVATFTTPVNLFKGKTYYVVVDYTSNNAVPGAGQIEDYTSFTSAFNQMIDGMGLCQGVQEIAGPAWTVTNSIFPYILLNLDSTPNTQFAIAS